MTMGLRAFYKLSVDIPSGIDGSTDKVLVVGGSLGMSGAPALTSMAAYKVGSGTVTVAAPYVILEIMEQKLTEVMTKELPDENGFLGKEAEKLLGAIMNHYFNVTLKISSYIAFMTSILDRDGKKQVMSTPAFAVHEETTIEEVGL